MKRIIKYLLYCLGAVTLALLIFCALVIVPVDHTPYQQLPHYPVMLSRLDSLKDISAPKATRGFRVGYGMANLTPRFKVATAGYGNRRGKDFTSVHDSLFVRAMVIDNGTSKAAIVTADLLIIPPAVTEVLQQELANVGFSLNNTFLGATHTHNSIGNWGKGVTQFLYGEYSDTLVHWIASRIVQSIVSAESDLKEATISTGNIALRSAVRNRLNSRDGNVDSLIRVIEVHRSDSAKGILVSYTAHATCLYSRDLELSRDYPGKVVDDLEEQGYSFAMFMAGAVGSHGCNPPVFGWPCLNWMSGQVVGKITNHPDNLQPVSDTTLLMLRIPLALPESQVKISEDWRVRSWLFDAAFGDYQPYLTALRIGDIVLLGTPCDYSGELTAPIDRIGKKLGVKPIVTSFNGHYIGYITRDEYYDRDHYETRLMNWYGPGNGDYLSECLSRLTEAVAD